MSELLAILDARPVPPGTEALWQGGKLDCDIDAEKAAVAALREATDNCPQCIVAAIRQHPGWSQVWMPSEVFDYKTELQQARGRYWDAVLDEEREADFRLHISGGLM